MRKINLLITFLLILGNSVFSQEKKNGNIRPITNTDIWNSRKFASNSVKAVRSMNDGEHFTVLEGNKIVRYNYENFDSKPEVIFDASPDKIRDYSFNATEDKLLIMSKSTQIYRRSSYGKYYVYDLSTKEKTMLSEGEKEMLAEFSPDGSKVAFVQENDIYIKDLMSGVLTQVTTTGKQGSIINGSSDWVYEEEFEVTKAFYWSPLGTKISYLTFDESEVPEFTMDYYTGGMYPTAYTFKYPKAGADNSKLSLRVYHLKEKKTVDISPGNYEYIPRMKWTKDDNKFVFLTMNRHQNELNYVMSEMGENGEATGNIFYTDRSDTYVEVDNNLMFLEDNSGLLKTSEKDGYNHIYKIGFDGTEEQITAGKWDVIDLIGIDEKKRMIYYTSAEEGAMYKAVYAIRIDGKKKEKISERKGYNNPEFSKGMKYFVNYYSNANEPYTITLHKANGDQLKVLEENGQIKQRLIKHNVQPKEFIKIKGATESLNAFIIKPPNFDSQKKYPVYFNIYNGPGHNTVTDSWAGSTFMYQQLLASKGYIVISVDTRGTMFRGAEFKKSTYLQLGKLETEDMIAVAKEVGAWDYVDADRIGVMGWSYGGYMTSLCMTKGAEYFKMGIAVAPVTNWRWYDNIYTERFMRTPDENASGYDDNSPINFVKDLKGKFLLVHGTGDDNVHVQNSMEMVDALVRENKDFEMFYYTNKNHGIYGGMTRLHLFNKLLNFTLDNL